MTAEKTLSLSIELLPHTSGTKKYGLLTLVNPATSQSVGLQVWGPNDRFSGHKFITGSTNFVDRAMVGKRSEKIRSRKDGHYLQENPPTNKVLSPSRAMATVKSFLIVEGCDERTADEFATQMFNELGMADVQPNDMPAATVANKEKEQKKAAETAAAREVAYEGAWGAW